MPKKKMPDNSIVNYIKNLIAYIPQDWIGLTTHRLDIYNEERAKVEFLEVFENLYLSNTYTREAFEQLPTAYDYIRLGHPLSSVLEWTIAKINGLAAQQVIAFSSKTMPVLAVLRTNKLRGVKTQIAYTEVSADLLDLEVLKEVYGYDFVAKKVKTQDEISDFEGQTIYITHNTDYELNLNSSIDFHLNLLHNLGSIITINSKSLNEDISAIQHVRRRETIAMTPTDCLKVLQALVGYTIEKDADAQNNLAKVEKEIQQITHTTSKPLVGSSGLSVQYAIMMGLIDDAKTRYPKKPIKIIVPPNCYGGTNDQARRVAASIDQVEIMDLPVDSGNDMVKSSEWVLQQTAQLDAVPLIIAEIPTNPRVEVPNLEELKQTLTKERTTPSGEKAIEPVFILDQTFCPNYNFLGDDKILFGVKTIAYVSGSKFPSGGKCTAGYLVANKRADYLIEVLEKHLKLCDNEATPKQLEFLAEQMPSMMQRIQEAYTNTREFVDFIQHQLPEAKINFVSKALAEQGFTPSVFSLDLPTKGSTHQEREAYKRTLNQKLIHMMITQIPQESKYCVSYGQLKGCYWTIPATSTQGTTKEEDKDYIARISVSPDLDLDKHKEVFKAFVKNVINA
jgi:cystathionine beta-lyase/cystathionine gamma-synthase